MWYGKNICVAFTAFLRYRASLVWMWQIRTVLGLNTASILVQREGFPVIICTQSDGIFPCVLRVTHFISDTYLVIAEESTTPAHSQSSVSLQLMTSREYIFDGSYISCRTCNWNWTLLFEDTSPSNIAAMGRQYWVVFTTKLLFVLSSKLCSWSSFCVSDHISDCPYSSERCGCLSVHTSVCVSDCLFQRLCE